jgi:hypothetical protein
MTGWRAVHGVIEAAGLDEPQASPKGLPHGFRVAAMYTDILRLEVRCLLTNQASSGQGESQVA